MKALAHTIVFTTMAWAPAGIALAQRPASPQRAKNPAQPPERSALPSAKTILERAASATGGESIRTQKMVGKILLPEAGISGTVVTYRGQRGETYQVMEIPGAGKTEVGNNGDVEWERSTITGPKIKRVASTPGNLLAPDPANVADLERFSKMETAGIASVGGKPCYAVRLWPASGGPMQTSCFDRETYLPVQVEITAGAAALKLVLGDYRPVGASKMPYLIETETKGQTVRIEVETITLNDPLPPEALELPDEIEKLAFRPPEIEIREVEEDKDRPTLRHRPKQPAPRK